ADYELLELVLFLSHARGDVKPLAKKLIRQFGGFAETISASEAELSKVPGVGEAALTSLKTVQAAALRLMAEPLMKRPVLRTWDQLIAYCRASMGFEKVEQFRVLYLDRKNLLVADEIHQRGTIDHTPVYPREVVRRALEHGASALIMVHNHPSGDTTPSKADIEMTNEVSKAALALGIILHDHVIVGRSGHTSFKATGLI
ncbi:MAG: DNA repair protein RadC, partial [Proteobacteria bacterium]|nr:DNA repair protein RadC [Pseudomonadota bacterium]